MEYRKLLEQCLLLAKESGNKGDYPIGALIADEDERVIASAGNQNTSSGDISAHAETLCVRQAGIKNLSKDLNVKTVLFSSEEPCSGCSFFIARTNISKVVWALSDPHREGLRGLKVSKEYGNLFTNIEIEAEPFEDLRAQSLELLKTYFISKNNQKMAEIHS